MLKIYLDPGHGGRDPGAVGNGIREKDITLKLAIRARDILAQEYAGAVAVKMSRTGDTFPSLKQRTDDANSWGAHFFLSFHINSASNLATGFESFVYPGVGGKTKECQNHIHAEIMKVIGLRDRGKKEASYHVLRETNMPALLTENGFINNPSDAAKMKDPNWIDAVARAHVVGIAKAFGLQANKSVQTTNTPVSTPSSQAKLYRVQVGAFTIKQNAKELEQELKRNGFSAYTKRDGIQYKVQVGAYKVKKNAEKTVAELKERGYAAFINES